METTDTSLHANFNQIKKKKKKFLFRYIRVNKIFNLKTKQTNDKYWIICQSKKKNR